MGETVRCTLYFGFWILDSENVRLDIGALHKCIQSQSVTVNDWQNLRSASHLERPALIVSGSGVFSAVGALGVLGAHSS